MSIYISIYPSIYLYIYPSIWGNDVGTLHGGEVQQREGLQPTTPEPLRQHSRIQEGLQGVDFQGKWLQGVQFQGKWLQGVNFGTMGDLAWWRG